MCDLADFRYFFFTVVLIERGDWIGLDFSKVGDHEDLYVLYYALSCHVNGPSSLLDLRLVL